MDSAAGRWCGDGEQAAAFERDFQHLTGHPPFRWQQRLYKRLVASDIPTALDLPTGLGKTSVMAIWLLARAVNRALPRRLVYVVDRRTVVDQATEYAEILRRNAGCALGIDHLPISTLRGRFVDNREWLADPSLPAIIVGTIDMIGSRLLFEGYGVSRRMRPYQAGLLGADTLVVLDEAHLCPPFQKLLSAIETNEALKPRGEERRALVPTFRMLPLSATGGDGGKRPFRLEPEDADRETQPIVHQQFTAAKRLKQHDAEKASLAETLAARAWELGEGGKRVLVYCDRHDTARDVAAALRGPAKEKRHFECDLIVGKRRVRERGKLADWFRRTGFTGDKAPVRDTPAFLVATSAGEVGVDLDADHMVCDLVAFERMVQRLGRVNRRGGDGREAVVDVFCEMPKPPDFAKLKDKEKREKAEADYANKTAVIRAQYDALSLLPLCDDGRHEASPQAFADLKAQHHEAIDKATTPEPLRPALDRAVVDAWSMTSLPEHTGRPEPEPWLRGWVEDDEPQAQVIWRKWLPWRAGVDKPNKQEVEDFFEAARPHASEILEAPVDLVIDTLTTRARALLPARKAAADAGKDASANGVPPRPKPGKG